MPAYNKLSSLKYQRQIRYRSFPKQSLSWAGKGKERDSSFPKDKTHFVLRDKRSRNQQDKIKKLLSRKE